MKKIEFAVIIVYSTSYALRAEKILKQAGIPCKLIPVPRHLSSDCGVCVRIKYENHENALRALKQNHLEIDGIHAI